MDWLRIYYEISIGSFCFFTLELFAATHNPYFMHDRKLPLRIAFLTFAALCAIPSSFPCARAILILGRLLYLCLISNFKLKTCLVKLAAYEAYLSLSAVLFLTLRTLCSNDASSAGNAAAYGCYGSLCCTALAYLILRLHLYGRRLASLHAYRQFCFTISASVLLIVSALSYFSLLSSPGLSAQSQALPAAFPLFFAFIAKFLTLYQQMTASLEAEARHKLLLAKYELETGYLKDIDASIKRLSALRHDFKNHLLILNGYASRNEIEKLQQYLKKISGEISDTKLIQTPSPLISSILNAKAAVCKKKNVLFESECCFQAVSVSDFYLITILGNLLDNAIAAAEKLPEGFVLISIKQIDSFLCIVCKNNHCEALRLKNGRLLTTKKAADPFHGIGIKNIQDSVASLNGTLDLQYDAALFEISVLLPNHA